MFYVWDRSLPHSCRGRNWLNSMRELCREFWLKWYAAPWHCRYPIGNCESLPKSQTVALTTQHQQPNISVEFLLANPKGHGDLIAFLRAPLQIDMFEEWALRLAIPEECWRRIEDWSKITAKMAGCSAWVIWEPQNSLPLVNYVYSGQRLSSHPAIMCVLQQGIADDQQITGLKLKNTE